MSSHDPSSLLSLEHVSQLQERATQAAHRAYAPYSGFRVGAALLLADGNVVTGCNVENASYRLTVCAEQSAIAAAVCCHGPNILIHAIAIANLNSAASQPCGACRQTILEFSSPETVVCFPSESGTFEQATIHQLLPAAFSLTSTR